MEEVISSKYHQGLSSSSSSFNCKKQMPHKCLHFLDEHFLLIIYNRVLKNWARDKSPISDTEFHLRSAIPNKSEFMDTHPESLILKFCQLGLSDRPTVWLALVSSVLTTKHSLDCYSPGRSVGRFVWAAARVSGPPTPLI